MAKLTKNQTAAAIIAHLQTPHAGHAPVASKAIPVQPPPRIHPWYCRYDSAAAAVLIYLPPESVAGYTLNRSGLTAHGSLPDWYRVPYISTHTGSSGIGTYPSWRVVVSLAAVGSTVTPTFYSYSSSVPDGAIVVAETSQDGVARPVHQYVVGAISLGASFWLPGPIEFSVNSAGDAILGQRWWLMSGSQLERPASGRPRGSLIPALGPDTYGIWAVAIPLYSHAGDHTDGVVTVKSEEAYT